MFPITDRQMKLLLIRLFFNDNPANGLARRTGWRDEIAQRIIELYRRNELSYDFWNNLKKWALTEFINTGSYMRSERPFKLKGSGRWLANDGGGRYRILRDLIVNVILEDDKNDLYEYRFNDIDRIWDAIRILYDLPRNVWFDAPFALAELYLKQEQETKGGEGDEKQQ